MVEYPNKVDMLQMGRRCLPFGSKGKTFSENILFFIRGTPVLKKSYLVDVFLLGQCFLMASAMVG